MALVNFSLPYQSTTMAPFFYTRPDEGHTIANNLRLSAMMPSSPSSASSYNEQEAFHNEPYVSPIKYHQHQQHHSTQQRSREIYMEHSFSSGQDTNYAGYDQDFRRIQPRHQLERQQQTSTLPSSSFQQQQIYSDSDKSRTERRDNYPERSNR